MNLPTNQQPPGDGRRREQGVALVIVLSFVVLLTVAVVAYFSRTLSNRQVASNSLNASRTEQLTRGALDQIVSDFKQEIANGSKATGVSGTNTYYPISADGSTLLRANMLPQRSGNPPIASGQSDPIPNLVRISNHNDPTTTPTLTAPMVSSRASNSVSTTPSLNGRVVSLPRWNLHYLIPQKDPSGTKSDPATSFVAPDWVMMTQEEGPAVLASPTRDAKGNAVTVTGRYAYAVYDEGGLLDANVTGFPSGAAPTQTGYKSSLGMSDLSTALANATPSVLLSPTAVDKLVGWRSYASVQPNNYFPNNNFASNLAVASNLADPNDPSVRYFNSLQTNSSGFTRTSNSVWNNRTDQAFLGRQQLIAFQQSLGQGTFPASALQFLGTFSRELNAPSWGPSYEAAELGGNAGFPYRTVRDNAGSPNRLLPGVRSRTAGTITDYRVDGTSFQYTVKAGDPLLQRRFPLGRLAWIGPDGPNLSAFDSSLSTADRISAIQACFGLIWGPSADPGLVATNGSVNVWKYVGPTGTTTTSTIKTMGAIVQEATPREPNFFELLQAGILSYSMGLDPNLPGTPNSTDTSYGFNITATDWKELQIFRIGASIITQNQPSRVNSVDLITYPMVIEYTRSGVAVLAVGVDDLPYLNMVTVLGGQNSPTSCGLYMLFGLWNPHQNSATQNTGTPTLRPPVRLCVAGQGVVFNYYGRNAGTNGLVTNPQDNVKYPGYTVNFSSDALNGIQTIQLGGGIKGIGTSGFIDPHVLTTADVLTAPGPGGAAGNAWTTVAAPTIPLPALPAPYNTSAQYVGYRLPDFNYDPALVSDRPSLPLLGTPPNQTENPYWTTLAFRTLTANNPFNCWLEFQTSSASGNKWIPYNYFAGMRHDVAQMTKTLGINVSSMGPAVVGSSPPAGTPDTRPGDIAHAFPIEPATQPPFDAQYYIHYYYFNTDPTTLRTCASFGQSPGKGPPTTDPEGLESNRFMRASIWSSLTEQIYPAWSDIGRLGTQGTTALFGGALSVWAPAGLARNNVGTLPMPSTPGNINNVPQHPPTAIYTDPDGIQRFADSGLFTAAPRGNGWQGDPYAMSSADPLLNRTSDRRIVPHRAFTNVADLGYVSRDSPWKTLDFFTAKSADAGLLDLFTTSRNSGSVGAGRLNLNTRNPSVLTALLSGSTDNVLSSPITALSKPANIATKIVTLTTSTGAGSGPLIGKDEIATRLLPALSAASPYASSTSDFGSLDEQNIKTRREAVTRALAESGQTRTWNLLVDVVAQAGRYAPNATALDKFTVEGERHYWLHVAIDRFTGQVIDQQLEAVTE